MKIPRKTTGGALLLCASFIWGTAFVAQSIGTEFLGPFSFMAVRFSIATLSLMPVWYFTSRRSRGAGADGTGSGNAILGSLVCGAVLFTLAAFQQIGIAHTTAGKSGFITTLYIVIVPLLGLFLGRRVLPVIWLCIAIALAGMYMLCINEAFVLAKGDAYMLGGALFSALHILFVDHFSRMVDGVQLSCLQFLVCAVLSIFPASLLEQPALSGVLGATWPLLYTGVLSGSVAYTFQILGQARVNPIIASLILSLESVFAALAGWVVLGEVLSGKELLGCALIFMSVLVAQVSDYFKKK